LTHQTFTLSVAGCEASGPQMNLDIKEYRAVGRCRGGKASRGWPGCPSAVRAPFGVLAGVSESKDGQTRARGRQREQYPEFLSAVKEGMVIEREVPVVVHK